MKSPATELTKMNYGSLPDNHLEFVASNVAICES